MKKFIIFSIVLVSLFLIFTPETHAQCAMCKASVETNINGSTSKVGAGLNTGILYLMTIPYLLVGALGYMWYRNNKKKNEQN